MSSHPLLKELPPEDLVGWNDIKLLDLKDWNQANGHAVFFADELSAGQVIAEAFKKKINHLVQKNEKRLSMDMKITKELIAQKQEYFSSEFCFFSPLRKTSISFAGAAEKQILKDKYTAFVDHENSSSLSQCAYSVFEELYMNSVMDAPREAAKRNIQGSGKNPEFFLATSQDSLQISVSDFYGSLDTDKLLGRMNEVYEKGAGQVINMRQPGGAGIGCVILFENSVSLIIGVNPGVQAKVTCILPMGVSNRQREKMKKSLHWFHV